MDKYDKCDELIKGMIDSPEIQELYNNCIVKDITLKEWVVGMVHYCHGINSEDNNKATAFRL